MFLQQLLLLRPLHMVYPSPELPERLCCTVAVLKGYTCLGPGCKAALTFFPFSHFWQVVLKASECCAREESSSVVDDMVTLSYLHEPGVLNNLMLRYQKNLIYVRPPAGISLPAQAGRLKKPMQAGPSQFSILEE